MTVCDHSPTETWYIQLMTAHRRGLTWRWPIVPAALGVAVVIGVLSPDRSKLQAPRSPAPVASAASASVR
jgi:hypothetical protein